MARISQQPKTQGYLKHNVPMPDPDGVPEVLRHVLEPGDLVLTQGAGNVGQLARLLADGPEARRSS